MSEARVGQRDHRSRLVMLGATDPGPLVTRLLDDHPADLLKQRQLIFGVQQRPIAPAYGAQCPVQVISLVTRG